MISPQNNQAEHFVALRIPANVLKQLLSSKALYVEDIHCTDNASKHLLKEVLMMSVTPNMKA